MYIWETSFNAMCSHQWEVFSKSTLILGGITNSVKKVFWNIYQTYAPIENTLIQHK